MENVLQHQMLVQVEYPQLVRRIKATLIDYGIQMFLFILIMFVASNFSEPYLITVPVILTIWLLYEPVMTLRSGTIGQRMMGIRVRNGHDPFRSISLLDSYLRFFLKFFLGWLSFVTIHRNEHRRAIHDFAGESVMICLSEESS